VATIAFFAPDALDCRSVGEIVLDNVTKVFPNGVRAVDGINLTIADGEFMVLVGPSGCGKTTLLRSIGGLETITSGRIAIGGREVTKEAPGSRDLAMVFQNYALYPHMTVRQNLGYGLRVRHTPKREREDRVLRVAKMLGLDEMLERRPRQLSGGQMQRVAMGRAIVREPAAFLMDEPLSNLDAKLRVQMRAEIQRLQQRLGTTTVYVTHDQVEAMTMGDRVALMHDGRLVQVDRPQALYERPADLFVAGFIGSPAMNFVRARLSRSNGSILAAFGSTTLELPARALPSAVAARQGGDVILGLRPEHLEDATLAPADGRPLLRASVSLAEPVGAQVIVHLELDSAVAGGEGGDVCACLGPSTACVPGDLLTLAIDPARLHFFDPETEVVLR
jgi:multiple sugar transport system ATP-binding protein